MNNNLSALLINSPEHAPPTNGHVSDDPDIPDSLDVDLSAFALDFSSLDLAPSVQPSVSKHTPKTHNCTSPSLIPYHEFRAFGQARQSLAESLFSLVNEKVYHGLLPPCPIEWNANLLTTAGRYVSKERQNLLVSSSMCSVQNQEIVVEPSRLPGSHKIELSSKVITNSIQLTQTLLHEMCHLAARCVSPYICTPPHGAPFLAHVERITKVFPSVEITRCHNYTISYKFRYACQGCGVEFGRHSKCPEAQLARLQCKTCKTPGSFAFIGSFNQDGTPKKQRKKSDYAKFQTEYWQQIRQAHPAAHLSELSVIVAKEYRFFKQNPQSYTIGGQ